MQTRSVVRYFARNKSALSLLDGFSRGRGTCSSSHLGVETYEKVEEIFEVGVNLQVGQVMFKWSKKKNSRYTSTPSRPTKTTFQEHCEGMWSSRGFGEVSRRNVHAASHCGEGW